MSVTVERFVNVMTAGKYGKGWDSKPEMRKDGKFGAILRLIDADLDVIEKKSDGPAANALRKARDDLKVAMRAAAGQKGSGAIEVQDGVADQGRKLLAATQAECKAIDRRIAERIALVKELEPKLKKDRFKNTPFADNPTNEDVFKYYIKKFNKYQKNANFDANEQNSIMDELNSIQEFIGIVFGYGKRLSLPLVICDRIVADYDAAIKNPKSALGALGASIDRNDALYFLFRGEHQKIKDGIDVRPLDVADFLAIQIYTDMRGFYISINNVLLGKEEETPEIRAQIDGCIAALAKLPNYAASPTFRFEHGSNYNWRDQFVEGQTFTTRIFWSTGRTSGEKVSGSSPNGTELHITIHSNTGKDVAHLSAAGEEGGGEVLFPPGTRFKTLDIDESEAKLAPGSSGHPKVYITVQEV